MKRRKQQMEEEEDEEMQEAVEQDEKAFSPIERLIVKYFNEGARS
jgi:hypothetical protein